MKKKSVDKALIRALWCEAVGAQNKAHAPYSKFKVGAALLADNKIFTGSNVENASYGGAVCAERVAILKAVSEGQKKFTALVVVASGRSVVFPCALCLQTMAEFFTPDMPIYCASPKKLQKKYLFRDLLPHSFGPKDLL